LAETGTGTKVGDLDIEVFVKKKVFWLQVSMHNHVPVTIVDAWNDLLEEPSRSRLLQLSSNNTVSL